jgi:hypothetical protein
LLKAANITEYACKVSRLLLDSRQQRLNAKHS